MMSMSQTTCAYHDGNIAVDRCERCNRAICLEGKRIYRKTHSRGTGSTRTTYTTRHVYCPPCKADVATNDASGPAAILGSIVFIFIGIVFVGIFASVGGAMAIFPLIFVGIGIFQFIDRNKKAEDARQDEQQFLRSLKSTPTGISRTNNYSRVKGYARPDKKWQVSEVSCFNCGSAITLESNFCMTCGDPTDEEKAYQKSH